MMEPETKSFRGSYLLFRKRQDRWRFRASDRHQPKLRHQTFEGAEIEARRLLRLCPDDTFLITQEVASVKMREIPETEAKEAA